MILGNIVKTALDVNDWLVSSEPEIEKAQQEVLEMLLKTAKDTAFGKFHDFDSMLGSENTREAFQNEVQIVNYEKLHDQWWTKTIEGHADITWPGQTNYFALSSGTTGSQSKKIPVTDDMINAIRNTGVKQLKSLVNFDLPPEFFEKDVLMLGSSTDLKCKKGHLEGEISGISASNIPAWFRDFYKPGQEIAQESNWDKRVKMIVEEAPNWDIGALSGIPSWIELMLKAVIEGHGLKNIHELWPNLQVYTSGGVAFEPYRTKFEALFGTHVHIIDTYLASEGFIAYQTRPDTKSMRLDYDNGIFYEFVPFNTENIDEEGVPRVDAPVFTLSEVEEGVDYVLVLSTVSGAWRYVIGDTVAFTDVSRAEIQITGRTKHFLNVVGSQLSVSKMNDAMAHLEKQLNVSFTEFTVSAVLIDNEYFHEWFLGYDSEQKIEIDDTNLAQTLDTFFSEVNKNYKVARSKALKGVIAHAIPVHLFHDFTETQKAKGGQVKFKRVMKENEFKEWKAFIHSKT